MVNTANAVGSLASSEAARLSFRANGGVGAAVRLLRPDVDASAQTAAAAALSLLGARDAVVQDSVRYLGGLAHLVDLLASHDAYLSETARYALLALRHGNVKNQAEVRPWARGRAGGRWGGSGRRKGVGKGGHGDVRHEVWAAREQVLQDGQANDPGACALCALLCALQIITSIRSSTALIKDLRKLDAAAELLRFEAEPPPLSSSLLRSPASPASSLLRGTAYASAAEVRALIDDLSDYSAGNAYAPHTSLARPRTAPSKAAVSQLLEPVSPLSATSAASGGHWQLSTAPTPSAALVEVETELLRKKHLAKFSHDELVALLEEMGFDTLDLRGFRVHYVDGERRPPRASTLTASPWASTSLNACGCPARVVAAGATLLSMSEDVMLADLVLPRHKVRKLRALQRAAALFDRIATLPRQVRRGPHSFWRWSQRMPAVHDTAHACPT